MAVQWFAYCNVEMNEHVAALLVEHGVAEAESKHVGMECADGKERDMWEVPGNLVRRLMNGAQTFPALKLRIYKRDSPNARPRHAAFLGKKRQSKKMKQTRERLEGIRT